MIPPQTRALRFGPFELDVRAGELRKHGIPIKLPEQSFQILLMLMEHPGEVVMREDIRRKLWPNNTIVEFDHSINSAIKRLRNALGESAEDPRYVETLAKRGYRFVGEVERVGEASPRPEPATETQVEPVSQTAGEVVAHYRLLDKLGEGGMGVVYRAEDLKLGRQVALKFLPGGDAEFSDLALRRFEREARAASALNHPNICTIYGLENFEGRPAIAMELVEGQTLGARLAKGRLPLQEALQIAIQIAAAMSEAHRKGIVHRDLKPGNIMLSSRTVTGPGVKVLDFGLAKMEQAVAIADRTVTMEGTVVGTPYYMSPEQAQGQDADARSDIFSFGVVLFEMLASKRPFEGQNAASVMAAILEREPPALGDTAPPVLDRLVRRCLAKDAEDRWQSARDLMAELQWIAVAPAAPTGDSAAAPQPAGSPWGTRLRWGGIGLLAALSIAGVAAALLRPKPAAAPIVQFQLAPPPDAAFGNTPAMAVSPDGRRIVFCTLWKDHYQLWLRSLDSVAAVPLPGTEGLGMYLPFWSPDSRSIGYFADDKLRRIELGGTAGPAAPVTLCDAPGNNLGGTWNRDGTIVFSQGEKGMYRVRDTGGSPVPVARLDTTRREVGHGLPWFLPDGRHFLFVAYSSQSPERVTIRAGSLDSAESKVVRESDSNAIFVRGRLLFLQKNILVAQPFDPDNLKLSGDPSPVAEEIEMNQDLHMGFFAGSESALVYSVGLDPPYEISWYDRASAHLSALGEVSRFQPETTEFSTDRRSLAFAVEEQKNTDIWLYDMAQGHRTRFTFDPARETSPLWSPSGRAVVFASDRKGHFDLYRRAADESGPEELLYEDGGDKFPTSWSPDGQFILYNRPDEQKKGLDMWVLPLAGGESGGALKPFPFLQTPADERTGRFSPDGKWVLYQSDESGRSEVYLAPFHPQGGFPGGKRQVSIAGGFYPRWRKDGREIFYQRNRSLVAASVEIKGGAVQVGEEREVVGPLSIQGYDVSGRRAAVRVVVARELMQCVAAADGGGELDDGAEEIGLLPRQAGYSTCARKKPFDLCIQILRDFQSFGISIRSQKARHFVIAEVHTVWTLIDQHSHRRIGARIRDKPRHRFHNQRIAHNQANALAVSVAAGLSEDGAMVKPHELH